MHTLTFYAHSVTLGITQGVKLPNTHWDKVPANAAVNIAISLYCKGAH